MYPNSPIRCALLPDRGIVHLPLTSKDLPSVVSAAWNEIQKPLGLHGRVTADSSGSWQWPQSAFDLHDAGAKESGIG